MLGSGEPLREEASMTAQDGRIDVLVVAASAPDLAGLRACLGENLVGTVRGLSVTSKVVGFGPANAASATARGLAAVSPRGILLLGTCGVYPGLPDYQPHDVVVTPRVVALDHAVLQGGSEWPAPLSTTLEASPAIVAGMSAGRHRTHVASVASPLSFTRSDSLASRVTGATGAHVENTEAYGVACAAAAVNVHFACVLGVANIVGSTGRADWQQFQREAATQAANALTVWLQTGAAGLPFA
jgi:nucleoside phosphorylase